jgi:hypothetical protein
MSSRNMCLLPRATLHSDSEHYVLYIQYKSCYVCIVYPVLISLCIV